MSDLDLDSPTEEPEGESYLASLSDLMVGMLFVFILMLMAFALTYRTAQDANERSTKQLDSQLNIQTKKNVELEQEKQKIADNNAVLTAAQKLLNENLEIRRNLLQQLKRDLSERGVQVIIDEQNGVLRLPEDFLFDSGKAELREGGVDKLRKLASLMAGVLPCYAKVGLPPHVPCPKGVRPVLEAIYVEGHTDNRPIRSSQFENNWALSTARAVKTYGALVGSEPTLLRLENQDGQSLLGVSGYGEERPVARNDEEEGRALNRRIDLRFLLAAPSAEAIRAIQEKTAQRLRDQSKP